MFFRSQTTVTLVLFLAQIGYCQNASGQNPQTSEPRASPAGSSARAERQVSLKGVIPNILEDQKQIYWKFPRQLAHGKHWVPVAGVVPATIGLAAADQFDAPYFRRSSTYNGFNRPFSGTNTGLGVFLSPLAAYGAGLMVMDTYAQNTALLAGEAIADSEILDEIIKVSTRRARPSSMSPNSGFVDTWFDGKTRIGGGFPSGHTIAAFSVATVFSGRYGKRHRWVPYVAYGLAGTVGFSRVTLSAHFPSDVFAGAVLGYAISHFTVLHLPRGAQE